MIVTARKCRIGFTLLELLIVLAMLALLSGAVVVRFLPMLQEVTLDDALRRAKELDRLARLRATGGGRPVTIVYDADARLAYYRDSNADGSRHGLIRFGSCDVSAHALAGGGRPGYLREVHCSPTGVSRSYLVQFKGAQGPAKYLLFAGLGGQVTELRDEKLVSEIFAAAEPKDLPSRPDTH